MNSFGKHFLPPAGCGSIFPAKSCWDDWRSSSRLVRGQVNMADETKLCSPIRSTFEVLVVWHMVRWCGEKLGPFWWPMELPWWLKRLPATRETRVRSLGWEDPPEKEMASHSTTLAWKIPCTGEPGRLPSMGSKRLNNFTFTFQKELGKNRFHWKHAHCGFKIIAMWNLGQRKEQ